MPRSEDACGRLTDADIFASLVDTRARSLAARDERLEREPLLFERLDGRARARDTLRFVVEAELDARGGVTRATARLPPPFDAGAAGRCVEAALRTSLTVTTPAHARPTIARIEVLLANGDSGGL